MARLMSGRIPEEDWPSPPPPPQNPEHIRPDSLPRCRCGTQLEWPKGESEMFTTAIPSWAIDCPDCHQVCCIKASGDIHYKGAR